MSPHRRLGPATDPKLPADGERRCPAHTPRPRNGGLGRAGLVPGERAWRRSFGGAAVRWLARRALRRWDQRSSLVGGSAGLPLVAEAVVRWGDVREARQERHVVRVDAIAELVVRRL